MRSKEGVEGKGQEHGEQGKNSRPCPLPGKQSHADYGKNEKYEGQQAKPGDILPGKGPEVKEDRVPAGIEIGVTVVPYDINKTLPGLMSIRIVVQSLGNPERRRFVVP